jgi:hypothetical protein
MFILPTMNRPERLQQVLDACVETGMTSPGLVLINGADQREKYAGVRYPSNWSSRVLPKNLGFNGACQEFLEDVCASPRTPRSSWLGCMADDAIPSTPGWDRRLLAELKGRTKIVSANDCWQSDADPLRSRLSPTSVFDLGFLEAMGFWFLPGLWSFYADDIIEDIGRRFGCWKILMDVKAEHSHVLNGKAPNDATYAASYASKSSIEADGRRLQEWAKEDRPHVFARVAEYLRQFSPEAPEDDDDTEALRRLERARSRSVMICTPVHRDTAWQYTRSLVDTKTTLDRLGVRNRTLFLAGCSNLPKARNELAAWFLASDFTDLLYVDADMSWEPNGVARLLASDKEVIGAVGRRKTEETQWCARLFPSSNHEINQDAMGAVEVHSIGTGFLKVAREALDRIVAARPDLKIDLPGLPEEPRSRYHRFFRFGEDDGGEDYQFCELWRSVGGKVWADPEIELGHCGETEFKGKFADALTPAPALQEAAD